MTRRSRHRCRPRRSPIISPRQPRGPDAPAGGARRFSFCCLFCAPRRQRDGGGGAEAPVLAPITLVQGDFSEQFSAGVPRSPSNGGS